MRRLDYESQYLHPSTHKGEHAVSTIIVEVMPKEALLDPQGKAVAQALNRDGNTEFTDVRIGKRFEITIDGEVTEEILAKIKKIADDFLSNSVIEDVVNISVVESSDA